MTQKQALRRAILVFSLLGLGLLAVVGRLVEVQLLEHRYWAGLAESVQEGVVEVPQRRGTIYDRRGVPLAKDVPAYSIALDNYHVTKPELLVSLLQEILGMSAEEAAGKVYRESYFTWLARRVDVEKGDRLREAARDQGIRGLMFYDTWKRAYPRGRLAPEVLGVVGVDGEGLDGLERVFDRVLRGRPARYRVLRGRDGRVYDLREEDPGTPGQDIHLTLDAAFQGICEEEISRGVELFKAARGFAIIMDPYTGEILALAQSPRYDPASPDPALLHPWAVTDVFEPGSTFKALIGLAALDQEVIKPDSLLDGNSPYIVAGHPIRNALDHSYGTITFRVAIARSVNTALVQVARRLGTKHAYEYITRMGFGKPTGIELPGEAAGIVKPLSQWTDIDLAEASFGQGISVTGVQLAAAFSVIASGGRLPRPHLLPGPVEDRGEVASPEACRTMRELMRVTVTAPGGTCRSIEQDPDEAVQKAVAALQVAAKSGTGQIPEEGGYSQDVVFGDVAAMFPWQEPRYVVLVAYDRLPAKMWDPINERVVYMWGGSTAGPTIKWILARLVEDGLITSGQLKTKR